MGQARIIIYTAKKTSDKVKTNKQNHGRKIRCRRKIGVEVGTSVGLSVGTSIKNRGRRRGDNLDVQRTLLQMLKRT